MIDNETNKETDRERAIRYVEESLGIHTSWLNALQRGDERVHEEVPKIQVAGNEDHHKKWIGRLQLIKSLLENDE